MPTRQSRGAEQSYGRKLQNTDCIENSICSQEQTPSDCCSSTLKLRELGQCHCIHIYLLQCCTQILMQFLWWSMAYMPLKQWKHRHCTTDCVAFLMTLKDVCLPVVSFLCSKSVSDQVPVFDRTAAPRAEVSTLHNLSQDRRLNSGLLWYLIHQVAIFN